MRRLVLNRFVVLLFAASLASLEATAVADVAPWEPDAPPLAPGEVLVGAPDGFHRESIEAAEHAGLVIVDLSDTWAPFIFSEQDPGSKTSKPNPYRETFISLANDHVTPDEIFLHSSAGRSAILGTVPAALRSTDPNVLSLDEQQALARAERSINAGRPPNFLEVYGIP